MAVQMKFLTLLLLYLLTLPSCVLGHGHMRSPRTRNYIAHVGGTSAPTETCPHCLNKKRADGFCGQGNGGDYDDWPDFVPWSPQENLVVGQEFNVDVWLDTNHAGHMELYMCNLDMIDETDSDAVQSCLDAHPLEFVRDDTHGIPVDTNYRMRAYFADVGRSAFDFVYKVPDSEEYNDIAGGRILMQWFYVTANSCFSPGYKGTAIGDYLNSQGWLRSGGNLSLCNLPFDQTGQSSPERFWNCAEVSLTAGGPVAPSTPYPVSSPVSSPVAPDNCGYCAWGACDGTFQGGYCDETSANCLGNCSGQQWCPCSSPTTPAPQPNPPPVPTATSPPFAYGNIATTTRYWDCSGGGCGCGYLAGGDTSKETHCHGNAMFDAPVNNEYGAKFYGTAAVSPVLFNPSDQSSSWLGEGCGKCWKVTGTSNIPGYGFESATLVLKGTNLCPDSNAPWCDNGSVHFDISAPGFDYSQASQSNTCADREPNEIDGFTACGSWMIGSSDATQNCDCSQFNDPILRAGCENFLSLKWNNVNVAYEEVSCPLELDRLPCWEENSGGWPAFDVPEFCAANIEGSPTTAAPQTSSPTTSAPTGMPAVVTSAPAPSTSEDNCCSDNFVTCRPESDWCSQSASNCSTCGAVWLVPERHCTFQRWEGCGYDHNGCCSPGQCMQWDNGDRVPCLGDGGYCQCMLAP